MGQAISSSLTNGYEVFNNEEEAPPMSRDEAEAESLKLVNKARHYVVSHQFEDAALAFYESAEIRRIYHFQSENIISTYERSAFWFIRFKDIRAVLCFQNVIELYLEKNEIQLAIQHCFLYGYKCEQGFQDKTHSNRLYDRGDELRHKHGYEHICPLIEFRRRNTNTRHLTLLDIKNFTVYKSDGDNKVVDFICKHNNNA